MATKIDIRTNYATRRGSCEINEDYTLVLSGDYAPCGTLALLTVADGIGGRGNGAEASSLALKMTVDVFAASCSISMGTMSDVPHLLRFAVQKANAAAFTAQSENELLRGMGSTCVAAAITTDAVHLVSVGDSRAYIFRAGELIPLTKDEWQKSQDGITYVTRAIGWQPILPTEPISATVRSGDLVLLCTDGLTDALSEEEIAEILNSTCFTQSAEVLADAAAATPGSDNVTVALAKIG